MEKIPHSKDIINIATFPSETDTVPRTLELSWPELTEELTTVREQEKKGGALWSPTIYEDGYTRCNEGVLFVTAAVADYDGNFDYESTTKHLKGSGYAHVVHSTYRSTLETPRMRVVIPLSEPVPAEKWREIKAKIDHYLFPGVESHNDPARAYYFPQCPPGSPRFAFHVDGKFLDPASLPDVPIIHSNGHKRLEAIEQIIPYGTQHNTLVSIAGKLRDMGLSANVIEASLQAVNAEHCEKPGPAENITRIARDAAKWEPGEIVSPSLKLKNDTNGAERKSFAVISAADLVRIEFPETRWIVPDILPEGGTILAGKPKLGKSWLMLQIALAVASGGYVLGKQVEEGDVLFLGLEDGQRRMQKRINMLLGNQEPPARLCFVWESPRIDEGCIEQIDSWLAEHPEARLVVVDTLKRIRPPQRGGASVYNADYESMGPLTDLSHLRRVNITGVHHTRKMAADDPMEQISGSFGLTGAADAVLVLKRDRGQADGALAVIGRDVEDQELALRLNFPRWELIGDATEYRRSKERTEIIELLKSGPIRPKAIAELLGKNYHTTKNLLRYMASSGEIVSQDGVYQLPTKVYVNNHSLCSPYSPRSPIVSVVSGTTETTETMDYTVSKNIVTCHLCEKEAFCRGDDTLPYCKTHAPDNQKWHAV